jgi:hypothetical protein
LPPIPTTPATPSNSPTATASPTPTPSKSHAAVAAPCASQHLELHLGIAQGAAGSTYQVVVLTNRGAAACTLQGYPGVSFVDDNGNQVGKPAVRDPGKLQAVTLAVGGSAHALLREPDPGVFGASGCGQTVATQLRVYPPNQRQSLVIADRQTICTKGGRTHIQPMQAGSGDG